MIPESSSRTGRRIKRKFLDTGINLKSPDIEHSSKGPKPAAAKPRTCPYFVSDPPGSQIMDSSFPFAGDDEIRIKLSCEWPVQ
jgi:hypothetical protein